VYVISHPLITRQFEPRASERILLIQLSYVKRVGTLSIYSQTDITTFDHMRGSVLGVDNPSSGFALVLRDMLARNGLLLEHDYTFSVAGGTSNRLDALKKGSVAATILYLPFDEQATQAGFNKLATSTDYCAAYASLVDLKTGFGETAKLDDAGLQQVIDLRTTYASTPKIDRELAHYRVLRWYPT
jgi:hypothetical protein